MSLNINNNSNKVLIFILFCFLLICIASGHTNIPQVDEGFFASPAYNLATHGFFGTTTIDAESHGLTRIYERTYWVMPLFLLNVSAFFKFFGASILTMRAVSIFWGIIALISFYVFVSKITKSEKSAIFGVFLLSIDYTFINGASYGRPDVMCSALGLSAMAFYVFWRERDLLRAVFCSQTLVVLAGLTHPTGGLLAFGGTALVILFLDRPKITFSVSAIGFFPYLIGGICFGYWIIQDFTAFRDQFIVNATMGGRTSGFSAPLTAVLREFTERYTWAFGFGKLESVSGGLSKLKIFIPLGYIVGVAGILAVAELRRRLEVKLFLSLSLIYFLGLSVLDGQKLPTYLVHIIPFYLVLTAIFLSWFYAEYKKLRFLPVFFVISLFGLQIGGMLLRVRQDTHHCHYAPAITFLRSQITSDDRVFGNSAFVFGLNFSPNLIDDNKFGLTTGKTARFIILDSTDLSNYEADRTSQTPESQQLYNRFLKMTTEEYELIYENKSVKIYRRKS